MIFEGWCTILGTVVEQSSGSRRHENNVVLTSVITLS